MISRLKFWLVSNRLGPDMPLTHILLYWKTFGQWICQKKFKKFGHGSEFRPGAYAVETKQIEIGNYVTIRPGTMLFATPSQLDDDVSQIIIEDYALIGAGVHVYVSNHEFSNPDSMIYLQGHSKVEKVHIKRGCWIGASVIILPGVTIGQNSVVGAGSVVTKSIPDYALAVGAPAKVIRCLKHAVK